MPYPLDLILIALLIVAAIIDAHERRLPNTLAAVICVVCIVRCLAQNGATGLARHMLVATAICAALIALEVAWRARGTGAGIGMGDIKLAFALMARDPAVGCLSFMAGLCALAVWAIASRKRTLPLIPFLAAVEIALIVSGADGDRFILVR